MSMTTDKPLGYGHDAKGAAGGGTKGDGQPNVNFKASDPAGEGEPSIRFTMDGQEVEAQPGETIFRVGRRYGIKLPHLCYSPKPGYRPDGNCRVCMVEIEGERVLAASCIRTTRAQVRGGIVYSWVVVSCWRSCRPRSWSAWWRSPAPR